MDKLPITDVEMEETVEDMLPSPSNLTNTHFEDMESSNQSYELMSLDSFEPMGSLDQVLSAPDLPESQPEQPEPVLLPENSSNPTPSTSKSPDQSQIESSTFSFDQMDHDASDSDSHELPPDPNEHLALENVTKDHDYALVRNTDSSENGMATCAFDFD